MKSCSKCGMAKPLSDFGNEFKKKDGKKPFCKPCGKIIRKASYDSDPQKAIRKTQAWKAKNPERANRYLRENRIKKRKAVIAGYGGKCTCCGEDNEVFLTLEHVNGGGNAHRKNGGSLKTYMAAIKEGFPDKYTILCMNCNFAKRFGKVCPHMDNVTDKQKIDALVEALENAAVSVHDARKALMDAPDFPDRVKMGQDLGRRLEELQAAIALAKGE